MVFRVLKGPVLPYVRFKIFLFLVEIRDNDILDPT